MKRLLPFLIVLLYPAFCLAAGSGMPWEQPLTQIMDSVAGPISQVFGFIAIVGLGLAMAFSEHGTGWNKAFKVGFGTVTTFTASSFFLSFLGFGGGLGF